jgi:hypothetical protein
MRKQRSLLALEAFEESQDGFGGMEASAHWRPLFLKRSSSFSGSAAEAEEERIGRTTSNMLIRQVSGFFITLLLGGFERQINFRYLVRDELFGAFSRNGFD